MMVLPGQKMEKTSLVFQKALRNDVFKLAVTSAFNHVIITDTDGMILFANTAVERITGYSMDEIIGSTPRLWGAQMDPQVYQDLWRIIKEEKKVYTGEFKNRRKDGTIYTAKLIISPIQDDEENLIGFVGTEEDISRQREVELMRTEFVTITAHQLKTPLIGMDTRLLVLEDHLKEKLTEEDALLFSELKEENTRLMRLVDLMLNISRIESGKIEVRPVKTNLKKFLEDVLTSLVPEIEKKEVTVDTSFDGDLSEVEVDPLLLQYVYRNLILNAINYSPAGSQVIVTIIQKDGEVVTSVQDRGYGIPQKEQSNVFKKHFRGSNVKEMEIQGNGIGLYLVKLIMDLIDGKVWFESSEEGSIFYAIFSNAGMPKKEGEVSFV